MRVTRVAPVYDIQRDRRRKEQSLSSYKRLKEKYRLLSAAYEKLSAKRERGVACAEVQCASNRGGECFSVEIKVAIVSGSAGRPVCETFDAPPRF